MQNGIMVLERRKLVNFVFPYGKENGVVMPDSWVNNEYAGNIWLRGLRKHHESCA
jgi:hypothetical protein